MTTPNLDALAKLAPFTVEESTDGRWVHGSGMETSLEQLVAIANEWAELRPAVAVLSNLVLELRAWRSEHDCRYTLGAVADLDLVHCPIDNPCVRCQRRMEWEAAQKENDELRAYRERTEAALVQLPDAIRKLRDEYERESPPFRTLDLVLGVIRVAGLWREPGQGATDGN